MKNRPETDLEYQKRVQYALAYIRKNLDKPLSLKSVSREAGFSPYHFHRIFTAVMQEPFGEYITRKKLEGAALKLAYSPYARVSDLAFEYGYSSVSSFSKAFNKWFGFRPTQLTCKKQTVSTAGGKLQSKYKKRINRKELFVIPPPQNMRAALDKIDNNVRIRSISGFKVHYLVSPKGYEYQSVSSTWRKMTELLADAHINIYDCDRFALCHDHPGLAPVSKCRYDACVALPQEFGIKLSMDTTTIPAGRYAVFSVEGTRASLLNQYLAFYTYWMPQSGYEMDNFPAIDHYLSHFSENRIKVELWAKITRCLAS